jgi:hypothetical protein
MIRRRLLIRSFVASLLAVALVAVSLAVLTPPAARAVGADDDIMGPSRVNAAQMAAWFRKNTRSPYAVAMPIDQLAGLYLIEGARAGVRGDIAFTQSILETRWFSFPAGGLLTASQNNFAGIGACDSCATGMTFATIELGVRAQMQQLRRYADPNSRSWNIGAPPVQPLWPTNAAYDAMNWTHGWAPTWQSLSGTWASSLQYAASINQLYNSLWDFAGRPGAGRWAEWELPGGPAANPLSAQAAGLASGPTVSSWAANRLDVFATGGTGTLVHKWWDGQAWSSGWENLGAPPSGIVGRPAAVSSGLYRIDVFARGRDDQLWATAWDGARWVGWTPRGGILTSSPAATSPAPGRVDVFVAGNDRGLWTISSGSNWTQWSGLGGVVVGSPAAVSPTTGNMEVFVRGTDDALYHDTWNGSAWSGWRGLGGTLTSGPAATTWGAGRIDIFMRGSDGALWRRTWDGTFWRAFDWLGGQVTADPGAASWAPGRIDVFVRGSDSRLWHKYGY